MTRVRRGAAGLLGVAAALACIGSGCDRDQADSKTASARSPALRAAAEAAHRAAREVGTYSGAKAYDRGVAMLREAAKCETEAGLSLEHCQTGCDLGHSNSCAFAGIAEDRRGDGAAAKALYDLACDGGSGIGCEAAGRLDEALIYLRVHCEQRHPRSCLVLGELYQAGRGAQKSPSLAAHFFGLACRLGSREGCSRTEAGPPPPESAE